MKNSEIADLFDRMGKLLEIKGENVFKVRAYFKAAENIRLAGEDIETLSHQERLDEIAGLGAALKEKVSEYLDTGRVTAYEKLTREIPESILQIVHIPSVGPKKAKLFFEQLQVRNLDDLAHAIQDGKLSTLPGIQAKTVANIIKGLETVRAGQERLDLASAWKTAHSVLQALEKLSAVKKICVAGSLRRMKETVGDIDILGVSGKPHDVMQAFVRLPAVKAVQAYGETKSSIRMESGIQVDLRVVEAKSFGAAWLYFTGSKNFNVKLRQRAMHRKMKINEYGVFAIKGKYEKKVAGRTEEECFRTLDLPYIAPELREDIGESLLFAPEPSLPDLVQDKDIRGDLHVHSTWSDGHDDMETLVQAARARHYVYLGISDHSPRLKIANGLPAAGLYKKKAEIDALNKKYAPFRVLLGTEVEIDKDGELDYNEKILGIFDIVIAAVHTGLEQDPRQLTHRMIRACRHPLVDVLAHPFCRHIGKRPPVNIDFDEICRVAAETRTLLEINAFPSRLDLDSAHIFHAARRGVRLIINTDAHRREHLDFMRYGVALARRGWLEAGQIANTLPVTRFLKSLKRNSNK